MNGMVCPQCGAPIEPGAAECKYCGEKLAQQASQQYTQQAPRQQQYTQQATQQTSPVQTVYMPPTQTVYTTAINPAWPVKSKVAAGLLAIFLGGFGIHKFYLGKTGMGILYLVFCWTYIPALVAFVEGIIYLCSNDENFQLKHHVRIR